MTTQNPNPEIVDTESSSTEEVISNELIEDVTSTSHREVIETVISSLEDEK